ncbi:Attractin [Liparis tanakae]|uniref:Attractin n=1 Tax=Liparis tanakae TaxID=230148 RepID=A0A4Z2F9Q6_9TELE|nr:Attractin [Liparis tanakae]
MNIARGRATADPPGVYRREAHPHMGKSYRRTAGRRVRRAPPPPQSSAPRAATSHPAAARRRPKSVGGGIRSVHGKLFHSAVAETNKTSGGKASSVPKPIALEPCFGNKAAVLSIFVRLPRGTGGIPPPGQSGESKPLRPDACDRRSPFPNRLSPSRVPSSRLPALCYALALSLPFVRPSSRQIGRPRPQ